MAFLDTVLQQATRGDVLEIRTRLAPPVRLRLDDLLKPSDKPNPLLAAVQPSVRLIEPSGNVLFQSAPYGEPNPNAWLVITLGLVALTVGVLLLVKR